MQSLTQLRISYKTRMDSLSQLRISYKARMDSLSQASDIFEDYSAARTVQHSLFSF